MFYQNIGGNIYVIVSQYNNYPCIGIRKCVLVKKSGKLIIGKSGVNLIVPQFRQLERKIGAVAAAMVNRKQLKIDLTFGAEGHVCKDWVYQFKMEKNHSSILMDKSMVDSLQKLLPILNDKIDDVFIKIIGELF